MSRWRRPGAPGAAIRYARPYVAAGLVTVAVAAGMSACTTGGDNAFHDIKDVRVPTPAPTTTTTTLPPTTVPRVTTTIPTSSTSTTAAPTTTTTIVLVDEKLYFINGPKLKLVVRKVPPPTTATTVANDAARAVLADLVKGALSSENVRTAIQASFIGGPPAVAAGVATVELTAAFSVLSDSDAQLAIAQLVYTLTELGGVGQVSFTRDGQPLSVPRSNGTQTVRPVTKDDYPAADVLAQ